MQTGLSVFLLAIATVCLAAFALFGRVSVKEHERRAAFISFVLAIAAPAPLLAAALLPFPIRVGAAAAAAAAILAAAVLWFLPIGVSQAPIGRPDRRVDERDIMFARSRLRPGTAHYEEYYRRRPENREPDDRTRALPGLMSPESKYADPDAFTSARASFAVTETMRHEVDGPVASSQIEMSPEEATGLVKKVALDHGALAVGTTEVQDYHVYTHVGRGTGKYGETIAIEHRWAIAFTVEMDHAVMRSAPAAPVVAESARRYVQAGKIAVKLASAIRDAGHSARAHIDGNYRVIAPLVALDAGLGEIGRMGILMTPRHGPRVRIGVVTTNLPLVQDSPGDAPTVIDFCTVCTKCAKNCPSASIPSGDREPIDKGLRWSIDPDACFRYWNLVGTDCGRCMTVCPYSHPNNRAHNLVRWAIRRSGAARRTARWLDDLFYGRKPRPIAAQRVLTTAYRGRGRL